ncbi:MAG: hypothetical protein NT027_07910 [Proteobacteria bacterium]|nr:hypothetical protein [Pseudomonadota bacterium]
MPLGKDNSAIDFGLSPALYTQYSRSVTDSLDLGLGAEVQWGSSIYSFGKYSLVCQAKRSPVSVAAVAGVGVGLSVFNTSFVYFGPIVSKREGQLEFYLHPRLNHLRNGKHSGTDSSKDGFAFGISGIMFPPAPCGSWQIVPGPNFLTRF